MKTVIFAGGKGTRLSEETSTKPKPMIAIGGKPMLWHIMNIYAAGGFDDFIVAAGYKREVIESSLDGGSWKVQVVDTGLETGTGGRLHCLRDRVGPSFMATYGDGVGNVDIAALVRFHRRHGKLATLTAVRPPARFGALTLQGERVERYCEKPQTGEGWINGGFFVLEAGVLDFIDGRETMFEGRPLERLAEAGQLMAFRHDGFWQPMDTLRDQRLLESLWASGRAPWKIWD